MRGLGILVHKKKPGRRRRGGYLKVWRGFKSPPRARGLGPKEKVLIVDEEGRGIGPHAGPWRRAVGGEGKQRMRGSSFG